MQDFLSRGSNQPDPEVAVQKDNAHVHIAEQVQDVVLGFTQLRVSVMELFVQRRELFVG